MAQARPAEIDARTRHAATEVQRLVTVGLALACTAAVAQSLLYFANIYLLDRRGALLDLEEGLLITWTTSSSTIAAGVVALLLSFLDPVQRLRGVAAALGLALISFDDTAIIHERMAFKITDALEVDSIYVQIIWPTLYLPLLAAVAVFLVQLPRDTPLAYRLVLSGLALLAFSVGLEVAGVAFDHIVGAEPGSWPWQIEIAVEECVELAGWIVVSTGLAARLVTLAYEPSS